MPARQFFIFLRIFGHLDPLAKKSREIPGLVPAGAIVATLTQAPVYKVPDG